MSSIFDPVALAQKVIDSNLSNSAFTEAPRHTFPRASSMIDWCTKQEFLLDNSMFPYPKQIQILVNLFEQYCPLCSDPDLIEGNGIWGLPFKEINQRISFLEFGVCPRCKNDKRDFRKLEEPLRFKDYNELIGVAGQRCLDPNTLVCIDGGLSKLSDLKIDDIVMGPYGREVKVLHIEKQTHIGRFEIDLFCRDTKEIRTFICSDSHEWKILRNGIAFVYPASELLLGDIVYSDCYVWSIKDIRRIKEPTEFLNVEVEGEYLTSPDGIHLHNSGKTHLSAMIATYLTHRWLVEPDPFKKYGIASSSNVSILFVATSTTQADKTAWGYYKNFIQSSTWFKNYFSVMKMAQKRDKIRRFKIRDKVITFYDKHLEAMISTSEERAIRGFTRLFGCIDELGYHSSNENAKKLSGYNTYNAMLNSLGTLQVAASKIISDGGIDPLMPMMANISSPNHENDPIMRVLNLAKTGLKPKAYWFHLATWEINPNMPEDCEELRSIKNSDYAAFLKNWAAIPPSAKNPFFGSPERILACSDPTLKPPIFHQVKTFSEYINGIEYPYIAPVIYQPKLYNGCAYLITCDAGESSCSYVITLSHYDFAINKKVLDYILEVEPLIINDKNYKINFPSALDVVIGNSEFKGISSYLPIWQVVYDRWQSKHHIQALIRSKIQAKEKSLRYQDFTTFKANVENKLWVLPAMEANDKDIIDPPVSMPVLRLFKQARTVSNVGAKVLKPEGGKDDIFRTWALADAIFEKELDQYRMFSQERIGAHRIGGTNSSSYIVVGNLSGNTSSNYARFVPNQTRLYNHNI